MSADIALGEDHLTTNGQKVRLTHIIRPAVVNPRPIPTGALVTPENSDLSAISSSGSDLSDLSDLSGSGTETESDSDTATEMGDSVSDTDANDRRTHLGTEGDADADRDGVEGYQVSPEPVRQVDETLGMRSPTLESAMDELRVSELSLSRTYSNSSSQYASSEGTTGSDFGMADSLTLPALPTSINGAPAAASEGWVSTFDNGPIDLGAPPVPISGTTPRRVQPVAGGSGAGGVAGRKGWQDKPSFFEYLYGA